MEPNTLAAHPPQPIRYLNTAQAAEYLGYTGPVTFLEHVRKGMWTGLDMGNGWRFRTDLLDEDYKRLVQAQQEERAHRTFERIEQPADRPAPVGRPKSRKPKTTGLVAEAMPA